MFGSERRREPSLLDVEAVEDSVEALEALRTAAMRGARNISGVLVGLRARLLTNDAATSSAAPSSTSAASGGRRRAPIGWPSLLLAAGTASGLLALYNREKQRRLARVQAGPSIGAPAIGGPFKLIDTNGRVVSSEEFKGKFALLYFGFTHCPDICPDELAKASKAVDMAQKRAGSNANELVPIFISVDPERDTVQQVREYVKAFHPKMVGLTGTPEDCERAAKQYRVFYHKTDVQPDGDYLVDHSIIMYLVGPDGNFVSYYGRNYTADQMADDMAQKMRSK